MRPDCSLFQCARITVQAQTPIAVTSGTRDMLSEDTLVCDANGLPALPSTSITGVLRHLYQQCYENGEETRKLFGYTALDLSREERENDAIPQQQLSELIVTWGAVHDSHNQPVVGRVDDWKDDILLRWLMTPQPLKRDRVRLNHRGTAADQRKYSVVMAPTGCRFTFEIHRYSNPDQTDTGWQNVLALLTHPAFRLGGNTKAGLGALKVMGLDEQTLNLRCREGRENYLAITTGEVSSSQVPEHDCRPLKPPADVMTLDIELEAQDFMRIGQGELSLHHDNDEAGLLLQSENIIVWPGNEASIQRRLVIPVSAIKGALAHRLRFHYNRLTRRFTLPSQDDMTISDDEAVNVLFGFVDETATDELKPAHAGKIQMNDLYLDPASEIIARQTHNAIDRFTGGTLAGALFSEELLWRPTFTLTITLLDPNDVQITSEIRQAFACVLRDLCDGRLALGAGASRGHGFFKGSVTPPDQLEAWCRQTAEEPGE